MNRKPMKQVLPTVAVLVVLAILAVTLLAGCAAGPSQVSKSGPQLWGENCARCHNVRPPASLNDAEWDLALMHMRTRAGLTTSETEKVGTFLKAAN